MNRIVGRVPRWFSRTAGAEWLAAVVVLLFSAHDVGAAICSAEALNCQVGGTCVVSGNFSVGDGCLIDFGTRDVEVTGLLRAENDGGTFTIHAGSLRLFGGRLTSVGDSLTEGGNIFVAVEREFSMEGTGSAIDVHAGAGGGNVSVEAAAISLMTGVVSAQGGSGATCGDGGSVILKAQSGSAEISSIIRASAAGSECAGGSISVTGVDVSVLSELDGRGGGGGSDDAITIQASDGDVEFGATAVLRADGTGQPDGIGSDGGAIAVSATGSVLLAGGTISAIGRAPHGAGGSLVLSAGASVVMGARLVASGTEEGLGGSIRVSAVDQLTVSNEILAKGGEGESFGRGGKVELDAGGALSLDSEIDVSGATGGVIRVRGSGSGVLGGRARARGTRVKGGIITASSCGLTVTGDLDSTGLNGADGGYVNLAGTSVTIAGTSELLATPCGAGGCVTVVVPSNTLVVHPSAVVTPSLVSAGVSIPEQCP